MAASNGVTPPNFQTVLSALKTLQSNVARDEKSAAHEYLDKFQKDPQAWSTVFTILQSQDVEPDVKLFAATTLKGKITYDLSQVPQESHPQLRDTLFQLLSTHAAGPKPIRTQLCVCLAILAIQMLQWKDVVASVVSGLGSNQHTIPCMLEFLHVLPEEVNDGRQISLSEDDLSARAQELLDNNADRVLELLIQYAQSSAAASKDSQMLECITSWIGEVDTDRIVQSPLLDVIINGLSNDDSFDASVECLCTIFRETRDVDDSSATIQLVYPRIMAARPKIAQAAEAEDAEVLRGMARLYAEAGECWAVLVARMPQHFRGLVEAVTECCARDIDREAIDRTFVFWFELKQLLVLDRYIEARAQYADLWSSLVDIMIRLLQFPRPEDGNENDLFDGDRAQEEKFREFRHKMGDVLKNCCEVLGASECLRKPYDLIQKWIRDYSSQVQPGVVPDWQALEAPLFSMRAMGREVSPDESIMLPQLIPLITQIPDHDKLRFQAVMVLGRYTEWTAKHPDTLRSQIDYIMASFDHKTDDVVHAAALSFQYFCDDCAHLLKDYVTQLQTFYESHIMRLRPESQEEITLGVASVIALQPNDQIYNYFKLYCDPIINRLKEMADHATEKNHKIMLADHIKLVTLFVQEIRPHIEPPQLHPAVQYCQEIFPVLEKITEAFNDSPPVLERVCHCWRYMVLSYRSSMAPLLPQLANRLGSGFTASRQGCFLWASDSVVREFSEGAENVDANTSEQVFMFSQQQTTTFLRILNDLPPDELPDMIEDFFRLQTDILLYFPLQAIMTPLMGDILRAAAESLTLLLPQPVTATLHFLRDFLAYGGSNLPSSNFGASPQSNPAEVRSAVSQLSATEGEKILRQVFRGMMYTFPQECFADASGVLLGFLELHTETTVNWIRVNIGLLPEGSVTTQEAERLMNNIEQSLQRNEKLKVRSILQDFTTSYRRRNVMPREGLGQLEATRFRFSG